MSKYKPLMLTLAGCGLLSGCLQPVLPTPTMQPVLHVGQANNRATEWNQLARYHYERGQLDLALGAYAQSLALDAQQLEARNAVAVIQAQQGHLDEARKTLLALVNDYPGQAQPHTNLGYVYYLQGDNVAAQKILQRAMALGGGTKAFQNLQLAENALRLAQAGGASGQTPPLDTGIVARSAYGSGDVATALVTPPLSEAPAEAHAVLSPRSLPESTSVAPEPQQIASRMELVQLAPSIFELKPRATAPALAPAPTSAAVPTLAAAPAIPSAASKAPAAAPTPVTAPVTPPTVAKAPAIVAAPAAATTPAAAAKAPALAAAPAVATTTPLAVTKAPAVGAAPTTAPVTPAAAAKVSVTAPAAATTLAASPAAVKTPAAALTLTTALATPPAATKTSAVTAAKPALARIEVANGNGITGMAKHYRLVLGHLGILVDRISNDKPYRQVATTIQYRPGFEQHAANLQKALQGKVQLASRELQSSDVRLVLGKDAAHSLAAASEAAHLQLNAAVSDDK